MNNFRQMYRGIGGLIAVLCLISIFSISFAQDGGDGLNRPQVQRPPTLPDLSAYMLETASAPSGFDQPSAAFTFTVNDLGDASDTNTSNTVCDSDAGTSGNQCTLRAAIEQANATPDKDTIEFDFAGVAPFTIDPASPLPVITRSIIIDGTSQTGYAGLPLVSINAVGLTYGLAVTASNSSIMALHIVDAEVVNLQLSGASNIVQGNLIGTDVTGNGAGPGGGIGIGIVGATNTIGGTGANAHNVISSLQTGILVEGAGATGNIIRGNLIGLGADGDTDLNNTLGIYIAEAPKTTIGGPTAGSGNVIGGSDVGITVSLASTTKILGNIIGLNEAGDTGRSNGVGISVSGSSKTTIGGAASGAGNVISGNDDGIVLEGTATKQTKIFGNIIGLDPAGNTPMGNLEGIVIGSAQSTQIGGTQPGQGNVISSNGNGISALRSKGITIRGNRIGTNVGGTVDLGNTNGIYAIYVTDLTIGGLTVGARNLVSGNNNGIRGDYVTNFIVQGNYIGTNLTGVSEIPNIVGIIVFSSDRALIGGDDLGAGNVISGSDNEGMRVQDSVGVVIQQNLIGTNAAGTAAIPNTNGMDINQSPQTLVGGTGIARNIISGNTSNGVVVSAQSVGTRIQGNYIGSTKNGLNPLGNNNAGISLNNTNGVLIGGSTAQTRNVIAASGGNGITAIGSTDVTITGNYIGSNSKGQTAVDMGNNNFGISLGTSSNFVIGGTGGLANRIIDSTNDAIRVPVAIPGIMIVGNRMSGNGGLGIDLGGDGVTANDAFDGDAVQNFPIINFLKRKGGVTKPQLQLKGDLNSIIYASFTLHFYSVPTCDASGNGEATTYLGKKTVLTNENGDATFNVTFPVKLAAGANVVATATHNEYGTSEFSACFNGLPLSVLGTSGGVRR